MYKRQELAERLKKRQVTRQQLDDQLLLAGGTVDYTGFGHVDLVIEAVFEDLAVKVTIPCCQPGLRTLLSCLLYTSRCV